jgi:hypothetical protein
MASGQRYGRTRGMAGATIARTLSGPRVRVVADYEAWGSEGWPLCGVYHPRERTEREGCQPALAGRAYTATWGPTMNPSPPRTVVHR